MKLHLLLTLTGGLMLVGIAQPVRSCPVSYPRAEAPASVLPPLGLVEALAKAKAEAEGLAYFATAYCDKASPGSLLEFLQTYNRQKELTDQVLLQLIAENYQSGLFKPLRSYRQLNKLLAAKPLANISPGDVRNARTKRYVEGLVLIEAEARQLRAQAATLLRQQQAAAGGLSAKGLDLSATIADPLGAAGTLVGLIKDLSDMKSARVASLNTLLDGLRLAPLRDAVKPKP